MSLLDHLLQWVRREPPTSPPPPEIDPREVRQEMMADPDFARVRRLQHDALQVIAAKQLRDGIAIRREREFWNRAHGQERDDG